LTVGGAGIVANKAGVIRKDTKFASISDLPILFSHHKGATLIDGQDWRANVHFNRHSSPFKPTFWEFNHSMSVRAIISY
jgi:hypothetical protein